MALLVQLVELELKDEENLLAYWVVKYLEGMEMEKVQGLGLVVVEKWFILLLLLFLKFTKG